MPITRDEILNNVDPHTLIPYEGNAAIHDQPAIDRSIGDLGYAQIITVDENMMLLGGQGRTDYFLAANKLIPHVQKVYGLSEEEKLALRLALNNIKSGVDLSKAKTAVNTLARLGYDLKYTGFNPAELASMIEKTSEAVSTAADEFVKKYEHAFEPPPVRESKPDPYAREDWVPEYPMDAPKIDVSGGCVRAVPEDLTPEEDKGLAYVLMMSFASREGGDAFLASLGRAERFVPGKRSLHIDITEAKK